LGSVVCVVAGVIEGVEYADISDVVGDCVVLTSVVVLLSFIIAFSIDVVCLCSVVFDVTTGVIGDLVIDGGVVLDTWACGSVVLVPSVDGVDVDDDSFESGDVLEASVVDTDAGNVVSHHIEFDNLTAFIIVVEVGTTVHSMVITKKKQKTNTLL